MVGSVWYSDDVISLRVGFGGYIIYRGNHPQVLGLEAATRH